jgi:hypothetical protein
MARPIQRSPVKRKRLPPPRLDLSDDELVVLGDLAKLASRGVLIGRTTNSWYALPPEERWFLPSQIGASSSNDRARILRRLSRLGLVLRRPYQPTFGGRVTWRYQIGQPGRTFLANAKSKTAALEAPARLEAAALPPEQTELDYVPAV